MHKFKLNVDLFIHILQKTLLQRTENIIYHNQSFFHSPILTLKSTTNILMKDTK